MNETLTPEGSPAPEKGVADILGEAFRLYRAHAKPLLLTCALLFVPAAIINSHGALPRSSVRRWRSRRRPIRRRRWPAA